MKNGQVQPSKRKNMPNSNVNYVAQQRGKQQDEKVLKTRLITKCHEMDAGSLVVFIRNIPIPLVCTKLPHQNRLESGMQDERKGDEKDAKITKAQKKITSMEHLTY